MIVFMISSGVALASKGELKFDLIGFITQAAAVAVRANFVRIDITVYLAVKHSSRRPGW